jgi:hypothetical protein
MAISSTNDPTNAPAPNTIVDLFPRRRLRQCVNDILTALHTNEYTIGGVRRLVVDANALFGDELIEELQRAIDRDGHQLAAGAIAVLRMIATAPARVVLWRIGRGRHYGPLLQLDALRALCQLGERVDVKELVALANICESLSQRSRGSRHPQDRH